MAARPVWALVETAEGCLNAAAIAAHPAVAALVLGTNDLAQELRIPGDEGRTGLTTALQTCVLAARAAGVACIDGVYNAFRDEGGLRTECAQGRAWGMDGKTLIHPSQIAVANEVFSPRTDEIALARRQIAAYDDAVRDGSGIAVVDGRIVENLHVAMARDVLARAAAIEARGEA